MHIAQHQRNKIRVREGELREEQEVTSAWVASSITLEKADI